MPFPMQNFFFVIGVMPSFFQCYPAKIPYHVPEMKKKINCCEKIKELFYHLTYGMDNSS